MRRSLPYFAIPSSHVFDAIVVGGGSTGCHMAARLSDSNLRTLLIEEGPNVLKQPVWHSTLPCALYAHRLARRYEVDEVTSPQQQLNAQSAKVAMQIPRPAVLGGSGVIGGRSWNNGSASDWDGTAWNYKKDLLAYVQKFEHMEVTQPHRGKRGKFYITGAKAMSALFKPFCGACLDQNVPLTPCFNSKTMEMVPSCGRPEVIVDKTNFTTQTTLKKSLEASIKMGRPLEYVTGTKVLRLVPYKDDKSTTGGVEVQYADGTTDVVTAERIFICAGSFGSAKLLQASRESINIPEEVGQGLWDCPTVVMQFRDLSRSSMQCLSDPLARALALLGWRFYSSQSLLVSGMDDVIAFVSSADNGIIDIKLTLQPFAMDNHGKAPASITGSDHGFQITAQLLKPESRGTIASDGTIDPNYFSVEKDRQVLQFAVDFVKKIVTHHLMKAITDGAPVGELLEVGSAAGGACSAAIDPATLQLKGNSNTFICGSSILPKPLLGDYLPAKLALTEMCADKVIGKGKSNDNSEKLFLNVPKHEKVRIIY